MKNEYEIRGDITVIFLKDGREVLIDTEDLLRARSFKGWWIIGNYNPGKIEYVYGWDYSEPEHKLTLLHRHIMDAPKGKVVDHINHDGLDNRKSNLRVITQGENMQNRMMHKNNKSGVRGVYWRPDRKQWVARIKINHQCVFEKRYKTLDEAESEITIKRAELMPYS